jgi:hypothetical protein
MVRIARIYTFVQALLLTLTLFMGSASAQTVTLNSGGLVRLNADGTTAPTRSGSSNVPDKVITYEDCALDRQYELGLATTGASTSIRLQAWAGATDCSSLTNRTASTQQCWKVVEGDIPIDLTNNSAKPRIRVRDILANVKTKGEDYVGPTSADVCASTVKQNLSVYVFWRQVDAAVGTPVNQDFVVQVQGPNAPTAVKVGVGDELLVAEWTPPSGITDTQSYRVYCDDGSSVNMTADAGNTTDAATLNDAASLNDAATLNDASTLNDAGTMSLDASADATAVPVSSDAGVTPLPSNCPANVQLTPGKVPSTRFKLCSEAASASASKTNILGLKNGTSYAIAVAAVDTVGNPGVLSEIACGTPAPVDTFFDAYRNAGGAAGGCSSASSSPSVVVSLLGLLGIASLVKQRRSRRAR